MKPYIQLLKGVYSLYLMQLIQSAASTQFASHVSVNTPARSFSHGVGDPLPVLERRAYQRERLPQNPPLKRLRRPNSEGHGGYPRQKPTIPFQVEEVSRQGNSLGSSWQYHNFMAVPIPVLPPSPYKVDSPDPESLWPIGLFIPPMTPPRFGSHRRADGNFDNIASSQEDPYLLEGSEAALAVSHASQRGSLYFHSIPHIRALLANQELRLKNDLQPHKLASIRHTWPFNRP